MPNSQDILYRASYTRTLKPQFEDEALELQIQNRLDQPDIFRRIPLKELFLSREEATHSAPASEQEVADIEDKSNDATVEISSAKMPVYGQASLYPSDWYYITAFVQVELGRFSLHERDTSRYSFFLPLDLKIAPPTSQMAGTTLAYGRGEGMGVIDDVRMFDLVVTRSFLVKSFVYGVALIPFVLSLLLAHMLFFFPTSQIPPDGAFIRDLILAVAGVVIAILPLRAVLVPPEVHGLSQVDFILGAELAFIVCLALVGYALHVWRTG
jgi:hypothetical protein